MTKLYLKAQTFVADVTHGREWPVVVAVAAAAFDAFTAGASLRDVFVIASGVFVRSQVMPVR